MRFKHKGFPVVAAALAATTFVASLPAGAAASRAELEARVIELERKVDNQGLLELARQIEILQAELRSLRGSLEELQFSLEGARRQQREQYLDLDRRIQAAEAAIQKLSESAVAAAPAGGDPVAEYQAAFQFLKEGRYAEARQGFASFLAAHPGHELSENARYWLGEAHYVERQYPQALAAFEDVIREHPQGRKLGDAMLKAGYCLYELRRDAEARRWLERVMRELPGTPAAREAGARLARMKSEGR
ncbi:MAG: tol-pal system protein YbgF [Steroidobacteraceae bacterium]|jgi:tol-pal system protein YbgF|nr:tol-pal system protein YbgF [Steroidobacteraceae bacterium]